MYGGHLHEGSEVLYLAEIAILVFNEHKMERRADPERKIKLLQQSVVEGVGRVTAADVFSPGVSSPCQLSENRVTGAAARSVK